MTSFCLLDSVLYIPDIEIYYCGRNSLYPNNDLQHEKANKSDKSEKHIYPWRGLLKKFRVLGDIRGAKVFLVSEVYD